MRVFRLCWKRSNGSAMEISLRNESDVRYAQHRDFSVIMRAVLPAAAEFAAAERPEWASEGSPLAIVASKYALCLASGESGLDTLVDGFAPALHDNPEEAEAFALFSSSLSVALLVYMLFTPHVAEGIARLDPDLHSRTIAGIMRASALGDCAGMPFWKRWLRRACRHRILRGLVAAKALPAADWVARFVARQAPLTCWEIMESLILSGQVLEREDDPEETKETPDDPA